MVSKPQSSNMDMVDHASDRNVWAMSSSAPTRPVGGAVKRAMDIFLASIAIVILFPLLVIVAIFVAASSKGPVLFWSWRLGYLGKPFIMPKFRTLRTSAPVKSRECLGDAGAHYAPGGRILRYCSIDELPQIWSILIGDMSLIGPRPLLLNDPAAALRLKRPLAVQSRPGITGLAQINGRNHLTPRKKISYDVAYTRLWSWKLDAKIFVETIHYVLTARGIL